MPIRSCSPTRACRSSSGSRRSARDVRAPLRAFDASTYRMRHAYEIDDRPEPGKDTVLRASSWLHTAVAQAVADAGLDDLGDVPVLVGTTLREQRSAELLCGATA